MYSHIQPFTFVALRLPSGTHKVLKILPNTVISIGKYGSFPSNLLLGRPYHQTYEILDKSEEQPFSELRIVPASELYADVVVDEESSNDDPREPGADDLAEVELFDIVDENGEVLLRSNQLTVDDPTRQSLTMEEIEELKKAGSGSGKDIIAKILKSHSALDEKTAFSLAKYTIRKSKKYLKRFTALPMDVNQLAQWMLNEKDSSRIMEIREEMLGLVASWSNVHFNASTIGAAATSEGDIQKNGRYLVIDDTGGLIVAALAERMGILYPKDVEQSGANDNQAQVEIHQEEQSDDGTGEDAVKMSSNNTNVEYMGDSNEVQPSNGTAPANKRKTRRHPPDAMSATSNTITLIHPATQPNLSLLSYFLYDPTGSSENELLPPSSHPLHTHLKSLSWLQLLSPNEDSAYAEPELVSDAILATWKSGKRGTYHRKRRRWERTTRVVDETRAGGFDALIVASAMDPISILRHTVPLLKGGAQIAVYSPNAEPLADLTDAYSSARKTAFIRAVNSDEQPQVPSEDFPVDPRLVLAPSMQTARAREWQVLPGRTHPLMTSRGGAEGFLFTGTRVLPAEGKLEARGKFAKKRKLDINGTDQSLSRESNGQNEVEMQIDERVPVPA